MYLQLNSCGMMFLGLSTILYQHGREQVGLIASYLISCHVKYKLTNALVKEVICFKLTSRRPKRKRFENSWQKVLSHNITEDIQDRTRSSQVVDKKVSFKAVDCKALLSSFEMYGDHHISNLCAASRC